MKRTWILWFLAATHSFANPFPDIDPSGQEVGNGGDVVFCPEGTQQPGVRLLDFYEGETRYELKIVRGYSTANPYLIAQQMIDRFQFDPYRREAFHRYLESFEKDALFLQDVELVDIPDSDHIAIPSGCSIRQVAIQRDPEFPEERRYTIDRNLWTSLDPVDQAGLLLHEFIYRDVLDRHLNSIRVRYLNALVNSTKSAAWTTVDYLNVSQLAQIDVEAFYDRGWLLDKILETQDKRVVSGIFHWNDDFSLPILMQGQRLEFPHGGFVDFYADGSVRRLRGQTTAPDYRLELTNGIEARVSTPIQFAEDGRVLDARLAENITFELVDGCSLTAQTQPVSLYESGALRSARFELGEGESLTLCHPRLDGSLAQLQISGHQMTIRFSPDGVISYKSGGLVHPVQLVFFDGRKATIDRTSSAFHDNGLPEEVRFTESVELFWDDGRLVRVDPTRYYRIDAVGRLADYQFEHASQLF